MKRYIRTVESELPMQGCVGIWWFYNNHIDKYDCPVDKGFVKNGYIRSFHNKGSDIPGVESGEVVYDIRSQVYEIICSQELAKNTTAIKLIAEAFEISNLRYDVIPSSHYYVPNLTGNPALDDFDFGD